MAVKAAKKSDMDVPSRRGYWLEQIHKANQRWERFYTAGNQIVDRYRLERDNARYDKYQDRYNILYSSTETMKPSLYAQTPRVEAVKRHKDRENDTVTLATMLLEAVTQYAMEDVDFDYVMMNVTEDYLLPGIGCAWVRYEPEFKQTYDNDNKPAVDGEGKPVEILDFEGLGLDYVYYGDFITGSGRVWNELPWVARRVYFTKQKATKRFGAEIADKLKYSFNAADRDARKSDTGSFGCQAIIYEIWDKENGKVIWFSEDYADDVLEEIPDPLHLKGFFPTPRPMRAVSNTRTIIPKSFYSQYKAQAEELDNLTERIRYLTAALKLVGVYDGSQTELQNLLLGPGNKMVKIDNWAQFAGQGGINGAIQWVPIKEVAAVLTELLNQRTVVKAEIYEITGFSDIVRGVSKASETLGAQQIKADWATGRLKQMQKETQRYCRDLIRIMSEVIVEHFTEPSMALYAGFEPPPVTPEEEAARSQYAAAVSAQALAPAPRPAQPGMLPSPATPSPAPLPPKPGPTMHDQAIEQFKQVVALLKKEKQRCAQIGIETDSTIMADEMKEREDRMQFLSSAGAFLQQAGPMALQFPDMRGLLGAIMMFTIRTFRSSRPLEKEFEEFTKKLAEAPPTPPPGSEGKAGPDPALEQAKLQSQQQQTQMTLQAQSADTQATLQADAAKNQLDQQSKQYEIDAKYRFEMAKLQAENEWKGRELAVREREVAVKEAQLGINQQEVEVSAAAATHDAALAEEDQQHSHEMAEVDADRQDAQMEQSGEIEGKKLEIAAKKPPPKNGS